MAGGWTSTASTGGGRQLVVPVLLLLVLTLLMVMASAAGRGANVNKVIQIQICIKGIHGFKLISYAPGMDQSEHHHRLASTAADWCFRLHGWPLCRRCWASTSSPTGRLVRRRLVLPPARLAYYAAVVGRLRLHRPAASSAADWCFRLHGWPLCRRCWASTSSPTGRLVRCRLVFPPARLAFMPPLLGVYIFTDRLAFAAADWCFRLHGWPLCRRCWASTSSPTGRLVRRRLVLPPARLAYYAAVVGRLRLHRPAASTAADWWFRLHGWPIMLPLLGVYVFTDRPPRPVPTGVSACTAGLYAAVVGRLHLHRPACLRRCRLVFPPARLAFMPPLLGVYVFTDRPPRPPPTGASACTAGLLCCRCWASTSSPTGRLDRRRLVVPPARLAYYAAVVGRLRLQRPAASSAADWCFRLHGWPIMLPLLGVYIFTDRLAFAATDWCFRLHGWPLCRRCWASTSSPTGRLVRHRLVLPPARLAYYAAVVGRLRLHRSACLRRRRLVFPPARLAFMPPLLGVYVFTDRLAFAAADWCFRLHGWPIMLPLLGVYIFTDRPPRPPPTGASACTAGLLCCRCWASTSSPTGRLVRRRLVLPPARLAYYAAVVGRLRLHRPAASTAADWCFRLHGCPIMLPLLGVYVFTDRPPHPPLTGVTACMAGLL
uniref:cysteine dioxygenase n=1 Tax=Oryza sativa subsp. japonica TaxID=39947 RepID=Q2QVW3_ORYSJ|nr:hypothetical protein LOC_Os12g11430 [Oryza sativa Japonica Group]